MPGCDRNHEPGIAASPWVMRFAALIPSGGTVLDVACGAGRHTRYLRGLGHPVLAVDIDLSELTDLRGDPGVELFEADLEQGAWPFADRRFEAIVVTNYLYRPHFPQLVCALTEPGLLIFESFGKGNEKLGRPRNPAFLLEPGELLAALSPPLTVLAYEHGVERSPRPAVRQRICAAKIAPSLAGEPPELPPA